MRAFVLACCAFLPFTGVASAEKQHPMQSADGEPSAAPQLPFDSAIPLASRITSAPESVRRRYQNLPEPSPVFHELTEAERAKVEEVLQELPAFARQVFAQHVRSISFIDGIPGNGTTIMEDGSTLPVFDIVLRAGLLKENISEFLTRKERSYYTVDGSNLTLSVEAGSLPAVLYVLLHESVHVLDVSNRAGQEGPPRLFANRAQDPLVRGIWESARVKVPAYQSPLFQAGWFGSGKPQSLESAEPTYRLLAHTPFVSLYGSSHW